MVKRSKWLMFATFSLGLAAAAGSALYAANAQTDLPLHVEYVVVGWFEKFTYGFGGPVIHYYAAAQVRIVDQVGQPVSGATVTGTFTGCGQVRKASGTTDTYGFAFIPRGLRKCGCVYTFTVTSVTKDGWMWNPSDPLPSGSRCLCGCN